jgi:hypothetical protein
VPAAHGYSAAHTAWPWLSARPDGSLLCSAVTAFCIRRYLPFARPRRRGDDGDFVRHAALTVTVRGYYDPHCAGRRPEDRKTTRPTVPRRMRAALDTLHDLRMDFVAVLLAFAFTGLLLALIMGIDRI